MITERPLGRGMSVLLTLLAAVILSLIWNLPIAREESGFRLVPVALEVVLFFALLSSASRLRSGRIGVAAAAVAALLTTMIVILKVADLTIREVLVRPLNPILDVRLLTSVQDLLLGMLGAPLGWLAIVALALAPLLIVGTIYALIRGSQRGLHDRLARRVTLGACAAFAGWFAVGQPLLGQPFIGHPSIAERRLVAAHATETVAGYVHAARDTAQGVAEIRNAVTSDRFEAVPPARLLGGLGGANVVLVFFESYGRSALERPRYAKTTTATLATFEQRLAERRLVSASAWLTSPTVGGQSWLANGTFISGLWLTDQGRYDAAMQSTRLTFARAFARAGYRTVAVKPAVTHPWPEGERQGFSKVYAAADLGYQGKPYNWITMPDQYTLSALERDEPRSAAQPLFAEVSLISSHTPWTPIPPILSDWNSIGDGRVFSQWAESGYSPDEVWSDLELMQKQYGLSVDYVMKVLTGYAERFVDQHTLLIVVGDHQPAVYISGDETGRQVPIHIISGDPRLLAPFLAAGFTPGMRPAPQLAASRMDSFRDFFLDAFSANADATRLAPDGRR